MTAYLRSKFNRVAWPKARPFSDPEIKADYANVDGSVTATGLRVIVRDQRTELVETERGRSVEHTKTIEVCSDPQNTHWGGLDTIDIRGTFTIDGVVWPVDPREGNGVETLSETFAVVHLIRRETVTVQPADAWRQ